MAEIKKYFKQETQLCMLGLEHPKSSDFYLSAWQATRSSTILLVFRSFLFVVAASCVLYSISLYVAKGIFRYWFIYLTHWGLTGVVLTLGFSVAVSARIYFRGPISVEFCLPWYIKTYWVLYNVSNPAAYLITIFYWSLLYGVAPEEELNHLLDVAVHALNSVVMILQLMSSKHPSRLLHVYQPLMFASTYIVFNLIYYFSGETDMYGNRWVYSVIDWSKPGQTIGVVVVTGVLLIALHFLTMGLAVARDVISNRILRPSVTSHVEEGVGLRQTPHS